ncbi:MAG: hypothetical protein J6D09_02860 [Clostridia bacterium]|nr:hypothetical protein [Clostridia bacterium]
MKKSKKIVLIVISCIVVLATIAGVIFGIVMNQVAPIVTKFEKKKAAEIAELKEKMPGYVFDADNRAGSVTYLFLLRNTGEGKAENFVKQHNLKRRFPDAKIKTGYGVVTLAFERDDYTNAVHNALNKLSKKSSVEIGSASVYSASYIKYKPDISQHSKNPTELEYTVLDENALRKYVLYDDEFINVDRIFLTKEDYDTYIDMLIASCKSEEPTELLETLKNNMKDKYKEDFFETNALLATKEITRGSGRYRTTVDNVYISDNKIYVVIRTSCAPSEYPSDLMVRDATFYLAVSKDAIKGATELITLD